MIGRLRYPRVLLALAVLAALVTAPLLVGSAEPPVLRPETERADLVLVEKSARRMTLMRGNKVLATYRIALGFAPDGDKRAEGDGRTPEGRYRIDRRNERSAYHLSLGLDYPRPDQRAAARAEGRDPGGDIFIHGQPNRLAGLLTLPGDWTAGCMAVSDAEIEDIWSRVAIGTQIEVRP